MKKRFYDVGSLLYVRNQKRTTGLIVGAIVSAVGALGAAGINAASQSSANAANMQLSKDTLEEQKDLFHEANDFNSQQAAITRDFNASEAQKNREFQAGQSEAQFQRAVKWFEDYSSPQSQVKSYLSAGLNPASLAGNVQGYSPSFSIGSGSAATASPASSSGVPQLPTAHVNPVNYGDFSKILGDAIGNGVSLASGYEDTKSKITFNKYYDAVQQAGLNVTNQQARVLWNEYNLISENCQVARESVNKLIKEIGLIDKEGKFYDAQGELVSSQAIGQQIDNVFKSEHWRNIIDKEANQVKISDLEARWYVAMIKSEIAKNYGAAAYSNALSELTAVEKEFKERGMYDQLDIVHATRKYWITNNKLLQNEYEIQKATKKKEIEERIKYLEWKNSGIMKGSEFLKNITQPLAVGVGLYYGARGLKTPQTPYSFTPTSTLP